MYPEDFKTWALYLAGAAHFGILVASAMVPRVLDWKARLATLPRLLRQLFWVYGLFIVLMIVSFGTTTLANASTLAQGSPLARWFCGIVAVFWFVRLLVGLFVFDAKPFLTNGFYRVGYHALTMVFVALVAVYGWVALGSNR